jgi:hypothetical protein
VGGEDHAEPFEGETAGTTSSTVVRADKDLSVLKPSVQSSRPVGQRPGYASSDVTRGAHEVFAIVRIDFPDEGSWDHIGADPSAWVTVKEVLPSLAEAEREVERLNTLNTGKGCVYFAQGTRLFHAGRNVQPL